jgi:hypothetical protein
MKTAIPSSAKEAQTPTQSSHAPLARPQSGRLAHQAAVMKQSPRVQAQLKLRDAIQNSGRVQKQMSLAAEINHAQTPPAQLRLREEDGPAQREEAPVPNRTGLPDQLKSGVESLSGISLDEVKVHYNSDQPAQLNALAYAQGTDIHVAPGQERHLPHEAWHIVQQKQGRVRPTMQKKAGVPVNDDEGLEREADAMGAKASQLKAEDRAGESPSSRSEKLCHPAPASTAGGIVQRFRSLGTEEYKLQTEENDHAFKTQAKNPALSNEGSIGHKITRSNEKQMLRLADDGTMAIHATEQEAKEFYAVDSVFADSQAKLQEAESQVKLVKKEGTQIGAENKTLYKIVAEPAGGQVEEDAQEFATLVTDTCIEMASGVMGNPSEYSHEAVFQKPEEPEKLAHITSGSVMGDKKINVLADALSSAGDETKPEQLLKQVEEGGEIPPPGEAYGGRSGRGDLDILGAKTGINRYAQPEVGEGFATFTVPGGPTGKMDYTGEAEIERVGHVWGYHFAGVVARSQDKQDSITLENYNRKDDVGFLLLPVVRELETKHQEKLEGIQKELQEALGSNEPNSRAGIQIRFEKLMHAFEGLTKENAQKEYLRITRSYIAAQSWFFQMYGSGQGQSFHEQQAASGAFVNPLTLRVRRPKQERLNAKLLAKLKPKLTALNPLRPIADAEEFAEYVDTRIECMGALTEAANEDLIRQKFNEGLFRLAAYQIKAAAKIIVRLALAQNVDVPGLGAVDGAQTIAGKAVAARTVHTTCQQNLNTLLSGKWFASTKAPVEKALQAIGEVLAVIDRAATYYVSNLEG